MNIGEKLKTARQQSHLTQEAVADLILVSRQTISNWENEKSYPDIVNLIKLSDLYQISLDTLLKDDGKMIEHLDKTTNAVKSNQKLQTFLLSYLAMITCLLLLSLFFILSKKLLFLIVFKYYHDFRCTYFVLSNHKKNLKGDCNDDTTNNVNNQSFSLFDRCYFNQLSNF